jgi:L-cysteine/cystine lyase
MTWPEARALFPVLDRYAYLNAGTFGPLARTTLEAMAKLRTWEGVHGRAGRPYFDEMLERRERVRALIAEQILAPVDNVALTGSTTQGVHVVVIGLGLGPGDEVVTTDAEHFGLTGPLVASGATLRVAKVRDLPIADVYGLIEREVTPRTRLIATSAVSWIDGKVFPWHALRDATQVPVLVDGAQSAGAIEVDTAGADFYAVSGQKWLCGPDATGGLYVADPESLSPRLIAYPSAETYDIAAATWEPKAGGAGSTRCSHRRTHSPGSRRRSRTCRLGGSSEPASSPSGAGGFSSTAATTSSPRKVRRRSSRGASTATRKPRQGGSTSAA